MENSNNSKKMCNDNELSNVNGGYIPPAQGGLDEQCPQCKSYKVTEKKSSSCFGKTTYTCKSCGHVWQK